MPVVGAPSTTAELILDPVSEDATNIELEISDDNNIGLIAHTYPVPQAAFGWASSVSTEGAVLASQRHENRTITISVEINGLGALQDFESKIGKLYREGGTLKRTFSDGREIVFDILTVSNYEATFEQLHHLGGVTPVTVAFECKPYGRKEPVTLTAHSETTLPALVFAETGIEGDMPALGTLTITDAQGKDQWWCAWGLRSRYYDSASTAGLFYEAEGRTLMGGSTVVTGTSPASGGASNNVVRATLTGSDQAILSTQTTGGGAHLSHVGGYRVFARVRPTVTSPGDITVALQWATGDFNRPATNTSVSIPAEKAGAFYYLIDLGLINIPKVTQGTQRWEGRIIARSTVTGNLFDIDYLLLMPVDEGYGEVSGVARTFTPSSFSARDEFEQTAGNLSGKTIPVGGTWSGAGSATDFTVDAGTHTVTRFVNDGGVSSGRFALAGTTTFTDVAVSADITASAGRASVLARYVDTSNWLIAAKAGSAYYLIKSVAGTVTTIRTVTSPSLAASGHTLTLTVYANGRYQATYNGTLLFSGYDGDLATGGTLASGKAGLYDAGLTPADGSHTYDNFWVAVPPADAAIFASQSLAIRHDGVQREDSTGTAWVTPSDYEGSYPRIPPSGAEGRTIEIAVTASRFDPFDVGDITIDDITAQLTVTPRYLVVPEL